MFTGKLKMSIERMEYRSMNNKSKKILGSGLIILGIIFFILSFYDPVKLSSYLKFAVDLDACSIASIFCALPAHAVLNLIYIFTFAILGILLVISGLMTLNKKDKVDKI